MKKTFSLTSPNKAPARQVEAIKHEIKKYIAREKRKALPNENSFWDFDCKIGLDDKNTTEIFANEIRPTIDKYVSENRTSFYIEVLVKAVKHAPKEDR